MNGYFMVAKLNHYLKVAMLNELLYGHHVQWINLWSLCLIVTIWC